MGTFWMENEVLCTEEDDDLTCYEQDEDLLIGDHHNTVHQDAAALPTPLPLPLPNFDYTCSLMSDLTELSEPDCVQREEEDVPPMSNHNEPPRQQAWGTSNLGSVASLSSSSSVLSSRRYGNITTSTTSRLSMSARRQPSQTTSRKLSIGDLKRSYSDVGCSSRPSSRARFFIMENDGQCTADLVINLVAKSRRHYSLPSAYIERLDLDPILREWRAYGISWLIKVRGATC